jgi:hypothetical protein
MLAFEGHDPQGDAAEFRAAGFGDFDVFPFEREGRRADGSPVKLAFTLAFAVDPKAPDIGFFTCHHRHPENFWDRALQQHPNTVERLGAVVLVAENPSDHHIFLSAITGQRELQATSSGVSVSTSRGDIKVMDPAAFRSHFGVALPGTFTGARLTALQLKVRDHSALIAALQAGGVHYSSHMGATVVAPDDAMGAVLVFEGA